MFVGLGRLTRLIGNVAGALHTRRDVRNEFRLLTVAGEVG